MNINIIFSIFEKDNPNPKTELQFKNEFTLLIAILLSAQTTDKMVNKASEKLFELADSIDAMLELGEEKLYEFINTLNYYKTKGRHIIKTCQILKQQYKSIIPNNREDLMALPGVGRKTANVFLGHYQELVPQSNSNKYIGVDTHVIRVSNRLGFVKSLSPLEVELKLIEIIPDEYIQKAHHWLVLHGRYICKAKNPLCQNCKIKEYCPAFKQNKVI